MLCLLDFVTCRKRYYNQTILPRLSDFRKCKQLINFYRKSSRSRPTSVCAVEMTMYVDWTCINVNRKDVHA